MTTAQPDPRIAAEQRAKHEQSAAEAELYDHPGARQHPAAPVPDQAVTAGAEVRLRQYESEFNAAHLSWQDFAGETREVLEAAAPAIREAERQRLGNRAAMLDEVRAELDDAFQFTRREDGEPHGYVTRAWVEALLATHAASAVAELEHYASQVDSHREVLAARVAELERLVTMQCAAVEECAGQVARIAELERIGRDMLHCIREHYKPAAAQRDRWEAILKGQPMTTPQPQPILTEQRTDGYGTYTAEWYVDPPQPGITYRVTDSAWTPDHTVRKIYAVAIGQGRDQR